MLSIFEEVLDMKTIIGKCKYFTLLFGLTNALFFELVFLYIDIQFVVYFYTKGELVYNNDFFRRNTLFSGNNEEIDAVFNSFHIVVEGV